MVFIGTRVVMNAQGFGYKAWFRNVPSGYTRSAGQAIPIPHHYQICAFGVQLVTLETLMVDNELLCYTPINL